MLHKKFLGILSISV